MNPHKNSPGDPLTDRQASILEFISGRVREQGYPPTIREIGEHYGIRSTNGVNDHLKALIHKGRLTHAPGRSRTWRVEPAKRSECAEGAV